MFHDSAEANAGGFLVRININSKDAFAAYKCKSRFKRFPLIPIDQDKIWRIAKQNGHVIEVHCNEVRVLSVELTDSECSDEDWKVEWDKKVVKISFASNDTASDFYRPYIGSISIII